jgi:hypothetical protein
MQTPLCTEAEHAVGLVYVAVVAPDGGAKKEPQIANTNVPIARRDACVRTSRRALIPSVWCPDRDRIVTR